MFWIALGIFTFSLCIFIFDWFDKTIVALLGALLLILFGVLTWDEAILAIDFETLGVLVGLMMLVSLAQHSGIFSWLSARIAEKSKGNPLALFLLFICLTFVASTFLNNVTVVLLIIPIAIALAKGLGLSSKLFVISLVMFSNIGGTLTLIGDPPNTIIGVQANLSFNDFLINLSAPVFIMSAVLLVYLIAVYWRNLKPIHGNLSKVFISKLIISRIRYKFSHHGVDRYLSTLAILLTVLTIVLFVIQPWIGLSVGLIALLIGVGAALFGAKKIPFLSIVQEIEWDSILFFIGLFVQVGALQKVGFLDLITNGIMSFSDNYALLLMVIIWGIGLASTVINNIPFVALMIPVIFDLQDKLTGQPHLDLLFWALALGACLGGNGTIIGSSAGLIAVELAKKKGVHISSLEFMKIGMPVTLISLTVASLYILFRLSL